MQLFHIDLSAEQLVADPGPIVVSHEETGLSALLAEGQDVLVTDRDGEFHAAVVLSVDTSHGAPSYEVHLGARLPMDLAAQRLTDVDMLPENRGLHEIVDLLGDLRRAQAEIRSQQP